MKNNKTKPVWKYAVIYSLFVIVLLLLVLNAFDANSKLKIINTGSWECAQTECTRLMTPEEIATSICELDTTTGQTMCRVNVDGEEALAPIDQLNLTQVQFCAEYLCVKEVQARDVNYPVNVTVT